jgi:hypothetical protein
MYLSCQEIRHLAITCKDYWEITHEETFWRELFRRLTHQRVPERLITPENYFHLREFPYEVGIPTKCRDILYLKEVEASEGELKQWLVNPDAFTKYSGLTRRQLEVVVIRAYSAEGALLKLLGCYYRKLYRSLVSDYMNWSLEDDEMEVIHGFLKYNIDTSCSKLSFGTDLLLLVPPLEYM